MPQRKSLKIFIISKSITRTDEKIPQKKPEKLQVLAHIGTNHKASQKLQKTERVTKIFGIKPRGKILRKKTADP
jgi:hypothetical protein